MLISSFQKKTIKLFIQLHDRLNQFLIDYEMDFEGSYSESKKLINDILGNRKKMNELELEMLIKYINENKLFTRFEKMLFAIVSKIDEIDEDVLSGINIREYEFPVYKFRFEDIKNYADQLKNKNEKINYYLYIKKEFPDFQRQKLLSSKFVINAYNNIMNEKTKEMMETAMKIFMVFDEEGILMLNQFYNDIQKPLTFYEKIVAEIDYLMQIEDINPSKEKASSAIWKGNLVDLAELCNALFESKTVICESKNQLFKELCAFFGLKDSKIDGFLDSIKHRTKTKRISIDTTSLFLKNLIDASEKYLNAKDSYLL